MAPKQNLKAKQVIPEELANRLCCPVCGSINLSLHRVEGQADQLCCDDCRACFELSAGVNYVRVTVPPSGRPTDLVDKWVSPAGLRGSPADLRGGSGVWSPSEEAGSEPVNDEDLTLNEGETSVATPDDLQIEKLRSQAEELTRLGNSHEQTQRILENRPGAIPEQVKAAMAGLPPERKHSSWQSVGIAVIVLLVVAIVAVILIGVAQERGLSLYLPSTASELLINSLASLDVDPASVQYILDADAPSYACPNQPANAALIFGGDGGSWTPADKLWTIVTTTPATIYLPKGMNGAYLLLVDPPRIESVKGPARIYNAVYVSINCNP